MLFDNGPYAVQVGSSGPLADPKNVALARDTLPFEATRCTRIHTAANCAACALSFLAVTSVFFTLLKPFKG